MPAESFADALVGDRPGDPPSAGDPDLRHHFGVIDSTRRRRKDAHQSPQSEPITR